MIIRLTFLMFLLTPIVPAQETVAPESVGFSAQRLDRIDSAINTDLEDQRYAGHVLLIARAGEIAYFKSFGYADIESAKPMATDSIFRWASMTKIITATAAMMLYEEGKFQLDDPASLYIPELADPQVMVLCQEGEADCENFRLEPARSAITIRHLLTHTSGITYGFSTRPFLSQMYWDAGIPDGLTQTEGTVGEAMKKLAVLPLAAHPGETFEYGLSIDMLGYLVEVVSGKNLAEFMQERIFGPLAMTDTYFFVPDDKKDRMATAYAPTDSGGLERVPEERTQWGGFVYSAGYPYSGARTYYSGGGGLSGTVIDYYRFLSMLKEGGRGNGKQILSPSTVKTMTSNHVGDVSTGWPGNTRGLGMSRVDEPAAGGLPQNKGTFWWGGFWDTYFSVDPSRDLIIVGATQLFPFFHQKTRQKYTVLCNSAVVGDAYPNFKK